MRALYPLLFPATFFALLAVERLRPRRPQPAVRGWVVKCLVFFALGGVLNAAVPPLLRAAIGPRALFDLSELGLVAATLLGVLVATFLRYWLHRLWHRSGALWRWTHQMHHSAERVDLAGFAYGHPLGIAFAIVPGSVAALLLGLSPAAAMLTGYVAYVLGLFEHLDIATPRWLGYLVQRPEQHSLHHARNIHAYNYSLPLWDLAFGTFRNPPTFVEQTGFWDGASARVGAMLLGRDVSQPPSAVTAAISRSELARSR